MSNQTNQNRASFPDQLRHVRTGFHRLEETNPDLHHTLSFLAPTVGAVMLITASMVPVAHYLEKTEQTSAPADSSQPAPLILKDNFEQATSSALHQFDRDMCRAAMSGQAFPGITSSHLTGYMPGCE